MADGGRFRVALATQGTRGDFQPMLALALAVRRAGHEVFVLGNQGHVDSAKEFGLPGVVCCVEVKDILNTEAGKRAMETGDLLTAFRSALDDETDYSPPAAEALYLFKPDIVVWSSLIAGFIHGYRKLYGKGVPFVFLGYQPQCVPSNDFAPPSMYRLELEPGQPYISLWLAQLRFMAQSLEAGIAAAIKDGQPQEVVEALATPEEEYYNTFLKEEQPLPVLMAFSPAFWAPPEDWPQSGVRVVGRLSLSREQQDSAAKGSGSFFNVGEELRECSEFIRRGNPPVYMGWGSMTVKSDVHMARLAVEALKVAGQRGVVVSGWAGVSTASLGSGPEVEELVRFCEENVLFMKAAPHEWLFPQCVCCVHHGGVGTVQASLGAGTPTIVTPVFADQHDIAKRVTQLKWGVGTSHLSKLSAEELGRAIKTVCEDSTYKANTTALAAQMAREDGCATTVAIIEQVVREEGRTGLYVQKEEAYQEKVRALRKRQARFTVEQKTSWYTQELGKRYPPLKAWQDKSMQIFGSLAECCSKGTLWYVKGSRCLVRTGDSLKSAEAGRYREFSFVQVVQQKGQRLQVKLIKGVGPEEGWVSTEVKGVEIVVRVPDMAAVTMIIADQYKKIFADFLEA